MWSLTSDGRNLLKRLERECGGRRQFSLQVAVGKNQARPILEDPEHTINANTLRKLADFCEALGEDFRQVVHYQSVGSSNTVSLHLVRSRDPSHTLTRHAQKGIQRLYEALYKNPSPELDRLRPSLNTPEEFLRSFKAWHGPDEHLPSERFFIYRLFRDKVISFLSGERHLKSAENPLEIFAIWYLVGISSAFYDDSPVGLDEEDEKMLPLGERETAASLAVRLLEELRAQRTVSYLLFEVLAEELRSPDSYGRLLFRIYSHAEEHLRRHFADDPILCDARAFVLEFPYLIPWGSDKSGELSFIEHRLVCCPLLPHLREPFRRGAVPAETVLQILTSIRQMYWNYYDPDSFKRAAVRAATENANRAFLEEWVKPGRKVPCYTLRDYIKGGFGRSIFE